MAKNNTSQSEATKKSKPILQFSVLCGGVAERNNELNFIGIFSGRMRTGVIPQFFIVNRWTYGKGTFKQKIAIKDPDLQQTITEFSDQEFVLKEEIDTADIVIGFVNVNFEKPGVYWIEISLDDELRMSYPLPVHEQQK